MLTELFSMTYNGIKPGLERITKLCESIDNPQQKLTVIHVAGTNGKGSTSAMLAAILQSAGYTVGLYTSPHIRAFNERIRINGTTISDTDILRLAPTLMDYGRTIGATFFEITTALALGWFAEHRVDIAVIETGLGGRLDATNIVQPILSVITYIDLDHVEYLGHTVTDIAREKAGIFKQGARAIVAPQQRLEFTDASNNTASQIEQVFRERAHEVGTEVTFADDVIKVEIDTIHPNLTMTVSALDGDLLLYYDTDLAGMHQARNVATVLAAIPLLQNVLFIDREHVRHGLANTRSLTGLDGRVQLFSAQPLIVLDVSHNPGGILALRNTLRAAGYEDQSWHVVFGAMADKDVAGMLLALHPLVSTIHICAAQYPRAATAEAIEQLALRAGYNRVSTYPSVAAAVERARLRGPLLICGSFHIAEEALGALAS